MSQPAIEGEKPDQQLRNLVPVHERAKCSGKDGDNANAQLHAMEELDAENGLRAQAVDAEQVHEIRRSDVQIQMLEAQQGREEVAAVQQGRLPAGQDQGQDQDAEEEAIVLEMNVVDDQQAR